MKNAALPLSPRGYSNWKVVVINTGMRKGFFVSPDGDSSIQGLLGLEAVLFDEAEESVLVHL